MQCFFMKNENESLMDVEHVEPTYFDHCAFFAALGSFSLQFCLIHLSLASRILCKLLHLPLWFVHCLILSALSVATSLQLQHAD